MTALTDLRQAVAATDPERRPATVGLDDQLSAAFAARWEAAGWQWSEERLEGAAEVLGLIAELTTRTNCSPGSVVSMLIREIGSIR